jgi:hypothetical protein
VHETHCITVTNLDDAGDAGEGQQLVNVFDVEGGI